MIKHMMMMILSGKLIPPLPFGSCARPIVTSISSAAEHAYNSENMLFFTPQWHFTSHTETIAASSGVELSLSRVPTRTDGRCSTQIRS